VLDHPFVKRTLSVVGVVLGVLLVAGCGSGADVGDTGGPDPSATSAAAPSPSATQAPQGPQAAPSPSDAPSTSEGTRKTIAAADVTDAQREACLQAILAQLMAKKGGVLPPECAILPDSEVGPLVTKALSGG
jgi:hypothetical protein